jgi:hypothetical protein
MPELQLSLSKPRPTVTPDLIESKASVRIRSQASRFLIKAFAGTLVATFTLIFLQGFHLWGFTLPEAFLHWIGVATIGELGGLLAMVWRQR